MLKPKQSMLDRVLSLSGSELAYFLGQLHPEDLANLWESLSPHQCEIIWGKFRRSRQGRVA